MNSTIKGLFINNQKSKDSIYESGCMVFKCLVNSNLFKLDYIEVDIYDRKIETGYDFYFFNYHPLTMGWLDTKNLKKELGFVITMILEVAPNDAFIMCPQNDFSFYCALDPTLKSKQKNVFSFPRPLEKIEFEIPRIQNEVPVIGSFGFATKGKGFQHVVEAVNKEFEKAIVRINIPFGDFVPNSEKYALFLGEICKKRAKPGIEVKITHDFFSKTELIKWCNANTLNCFLYDRNVPGLSATTDQAIITEKPLAISENETFRHIISYLKPYPFCSLKDSIKNSSVFVKKMKDDWQPEKFQEKFENIIQQYNFKSENRFIDSYVLPLRKRSIKNFFQHRIKKYKRKLSFKNLKSILENNNEII